MYDFITSIEDEIEDVMDRSSEENIFSNIIIDTGDYFLLDMFDEYGRTYKVEIVIYRYFCCYIYCVLIFMICGKLSIGYTGVSC